MDDQIRVGVYRIDSHLPKDLPRSVETHRLRAAALHDIFDATSGMTVRDWGNTDDARRSHEFVELVVEFVQWATQPQQLEAASAAAIATGKFLAATAVGEIVKEGVVRLYGRLRQKQQKGEIHNVNINVTPKIHIFMNAPSSGGAASITVELETGPIRTSAS